MQKIVSFLKSEDGASAAEYALILAIIGAGVGVAVFSLGSAISGKINSATSCINASSTTSSSACGGTASS